MATAMTLRRIMRGVAVKSPSRCDVSGTLCMREIAPAAGVSVLEEHGGLTIGCADGATERGQGGRERTPACRRQLLDRADQSLLGGIRSPGHDAAAERRQHQLDGAAVPF